MAKYRARPPLNKQRLDDSCWAAALESFSRVTSGVPTQREDDLISRFGVGATGGLNNTALTSLTTHLQTFHMKVDLIGTLSMPYDIEDRLQKSHVVLARHLGGTAWHAWLVYGVDAWIMYMDPRDGQLHKMNWGTNAAFTSARGYYAMWKP